MPWTIKVPNLRISESRPIRRTALAYAINVCEAKACHLD